MKKNILRNSNSFDKTWEAIYLSGHSQLYPWDIVVSFIFRNSPLKSSRKNIKILEVGFGTGSNLWFAAREGFDVYGIEASKIAVNFAKERFKSDSLKGNLRHGNFIKLPFKDNFFDLILDRCSLVCVGRNSQKRAFKEIHRVLKKGGKFFHNTYSKNCTSYKTGEIGKDGLTINMKRGTNASLGQLYFNSEEEIRDKFKTKWKLLQIQKRKNCEIIKPRTIHEEWIVIAEKI